MTVVNPETLVTTGSVSEATSDRVVRVLAELPKPIYNALLRGADAAGMTPDDFLRWAIKESEFIATERQRGSRFFVSTNTGLREVVD